MERVQAAGRAEVAQLLRTMADGIERGALDFGEEAYPLSDELVATVDAPPVSAASMVVAVHFEWPEGRADHLAVEQELVHPGG
jgi:hypothetical protein